MCTSRSRPLPAGALPGGLRNFTYVTAENEGPASSRSRDTLAWRYSPAAELRTLRTPRGLARLARDFAYFRRCASAAPG